MKILAKYISANTQIHNGKCYFLGMVAENSKTSKAYNMESGGTAAAGNQVGYIHEDGNNVCILPKPGIECSNGLYATVDSSDLMVYYSI